MITLQRKCSGQPLTNSDDFFEKMTFSCVLQKIIRFNMSVDSENPWAALADSAIALYRAHGEHGATWRRLFTPWAQTQILWHRRMEEQYEAIARDLSGCGVDGTHTDENYQNFGTKCTSFLPELFKGLACSRAAFGWRDFGASKPWEDEACNFHPWFRFTPDSEVPRRGRSDATTQ